MIWAIVNLVVLGWWPSFPSLPSDLCQSSFFQCTSTHTLMCQSGFSLLCGSNYSSLSPPTVILPFPSCESQSFRSDQIRSVAQSCPTLCNPMNPSTPSLPVHYQLPEFTQTHVHQVSDAIQPSHPLSSPSPPAPNPSQQQSLFQWVNSSHEVAKVLEFQL